MDTNTNTLLSAATSITKIADSSETGDFRYLVKVRWEWTTDTYVVETPLDTDSAADLLALITADGRDEGAYAEIIARF